MRYSSVAVLLVLAFGSCVQTYHRHRISRGDACSRALRLNASEQHQLEDVVTTCIDEQDELQAFINSLRYSSYFAWHHGGGHDDKQRDLAAVLDASGYPSEATALRMCIAEKMGLVISNDTFDMDSFKSSISDKVFGLSIEKNTQLGLNNCGDVVEFNILEYLRCIMTYCVTGDAP